MTASNNAPDTNPKPLTFLKQIGRRIWLLIIGIVLISALSLGWSRLSNAPVDYANINDHFKYGSIGSEPANGIPYWIWKVLPKMFSEYLPENGKDGYASLGFIYEPGKDLPVGFAKRRVLIDRVGLNCAVCHTGTLRETPDSPHQVITAMPANVLNLQGYIQFLGKVAQDSRFVPDEMLPYIEASNGHLNPIQKLIYRYIAIPMTRGALGIQGKRLSFLNDQPKWGPGRVDTFNPYKTLQFNFPMDKLPEKELIGTADFPSVWNQKPRKGLQLHWDGDNDSVDERNLSAGLGAGITPTTVDRARLKRIADWLWELPPPAYPYKVNQDLAAKGQPIFQNTCASCHAFGAESVGKVVPIQDIGTDPHRLNSYTDELLSNQNTLFAGYPERFKHFRKTNGYANTPLDGIWLRAPYLHNGSVPTLRDLLETPENRPKVFYRGDDLFDQKNVGFVSNVAQEGEQKFFKFDTTIPGNSNTGHVYGTELSSEDKNALVEYMKQL